MFRNIIEKIRKFFIDSAMPSKTEIIIDQIIEKTISGDMKWIIEHHEGCDYDGEGFNYYEANATYKKSDLCLVTGSHLDIYPDRNNLEERIFIVRTPCKLDTLIIEKYKELKNQNSINAQDKMMKAMTS